MNVALEVIKVSKSFYQSGGTLPHPKWRFMKQQPRRQVIALAELSFSVEHHEIYGLLGPSDAGKSTLIKLITGQLSPDAGQVTLFGLDVQRHRIGVRRLVSLVSEETAPPKERSAMQNLLHAARIYGMGEPEARYRAVEMLLMMRLAPQKWEAPMQHLTSGEEQKTAIAIAMIHRPGVLLLDEPTGGLSPLVRWEVQEFIREIQRESGVTIILASNDLEEVERLCDRVALIQGGKLLAEGTPAQIKPQVYQRYII